MDRLRIDVMLLNGAAFCGFTFLSDALSLEMIIVQEVGRVSTYFTKEYTVFVMSAIL